MWSLSREISYYHRLSHSLKSPEADSRSLDCVGEPLQCEYQGLDDTNHDDLNAGRVWMPLSMEALLEASEEARSDSREVERSLFILIDTY